MPVNFPLLRVHCYCNHLTVLYFWSTLFALPLLVHIACIFVVSNELLAVLSSVESFYEFRTYSIHKRAIVSGSNLANMILSSIVFVHWYLIDENIPRPSNYLFVLVAYLHKFSKVRVSFVWNKLVFAEKLVLLPFLELLSPLSNLFQFMKDSVNDFVLTIYNLFVFSHLQAHNCLPLLLLFVLFLQLNELLFQAIDFTLHFVHF